MRAALDAGCVLLAPQSAYLVANKLVLGWLSEGLPWMTDDDRAVVDRYLPWTRVVGDRPPGGGTSPAAARAARRAPAGVRPQTGPRPQRPRPAGRPLLRRRPVAAGVLDAVRTGDRIAQEYVEPVPYRMEFADDDGESTYEGEVFPLLSPYLFEGRPAGCLVRYLPPGREGVISVQGTGALRRWRWRCAEHAPLTRRCGSADPAVWPARLAVRWARPSIRARRRDARAHAVPGTAAGRARRGRAAPRAEGGERHHHGTGHGGERVDAEPQVAASASTSTPPSHGPNTAPNRPMPATQPTAVSRLAARWCPPTLAYTIVCALKSIAPVRNTTT
ncbi:hypothetical protein NKH77_40475 [Streptomyces sp. M19]